jgi:hypothetical protein
MLFAILVHMIDVFKIDIRFSDGSAVEYGLLKLDKEVLK